MGNGAKFAIHILQEPIALGKKSRLFPAQIGGRFELSQIQDQCDDRLPGTIVQFACNPPSFFSSWSFITFPRSAGGQRRPPCDRLYRGLFRASR